MKIWITLLILSLASTALATEESASAPKATDGPVLSADASWATNMVLMVGAMFLAAMVVGPLVRATAPREVPPAHSHDEPPGTSGHHGPGGTRDLNPPEKEGH